MQSVLCCVIFFDFFVVLCVWCITFRKCFCVSGLACSCYLIHTVFILFILQSGFYCLFSMNKILFIIWQNDVNSSNIFFSVGWLCLSRWWCPETRD